MKDAEKYLSDGLANEVLIGYAYSMMTMTSTKKTKETSIMGRMFKVVLLMLTLTVGFALPAHAETPPSTITSNVVDKTGKVDVARAKMMVDQVQAETDYELFIYFTDSFDGQSGAQWVDTAYRNAKLGGSNAVLYVIATGDRLYGSSAMKNTPAYENLSKMEKSAIPALKNGDWNGAVQAYGNALLDVAHPAPAPAVDNSKTDAATAGFIGVVGWVVAALAGLAILIIGGFFARKSFIHLRAQNEDNRMYRKELNKLKVSVPASISKLDEVLNDLSGRIAFAAGMFGAEVLEKAKRAEKIAKEELQRAIAALGEVTAAERSAIDVKRKVAELGNVAAIVSSANRQFEVADTTIASAEKLHASVESNLTSLQQTLTNAIDTFKVETEAVNALSAKFDVDYLSQVLAKQKKFEVSTDEFAASVSKAQAAMAGQELAKADAATTEAVEKANKVVTAHKALVKEMDDAKGFVAKRDDSIKKISKEISAQNDENSHKDVRPLIEKVKTAIVEAAKIPADRGNPVTAYNDVLGGAVAEYRVKVGELTSQREKWVELNRSANRFFTTESRKMSTLKNNISSLRLPVSPNDSAKMRHADDAIARLSAEYDHAVQNMTPYDLVSLTALLRKIEAEVSSATDRVAPLIKTAEAAKRRAAEEEAARKRKREEEARAKRKREEDARRRRNSSYSSSSSSSSYGYGAGYASSSYSSSSYSSSSYDSGSSGGSFSSDSGSSGGSF